MVFVIHWHESAMDLHVFPIPIPAPTSLSTRSFWVFPVHQARALVSCIQPGLVICFTLDNIHVSMLFSRNIPPSPSFDLCTCISLCLDWFFPKINSGFSLYVTPQRSFLSPQPKSALIFRFSANTSIFPLHSTHPTV